MIFDVDFPAFELIEQAVAQEKYILAMVDGAGDVSKDGAAYAYLGQYESFLGDDLSAGNPKQPGCQVVFGAEQPFLLKLVCKGLGYADQGGARIQYEGLMQMGA